MAEISDYLGGLEDQQVQEKKVTIVNNPVLTVLFEKYEKWLLKKHPVNGDPYNSAFSLIKKIKCTAKEVGDFCIGLKLYEKKDEFFNYSGEFLSVVINNCSEENIEISTKHLTGELWFVGMRLEGKNLTVKGYTSGAGTEMRSGTLTLLGDANNAGMSMTGGKLIINGNLENGGPFLGGEVHINGAGFSFNQHKECNAKVYWKRKLIWQA